MNKLTKVKRARKSLQDKSNEFKANGLPSRRFEFKANGPPNKRFERAIILKLKKKKKKSQQFARIH